MSDVTILGLDFPILVDFVAAIVGVPTFALTCYKFGRRAGNAGDKEIIASLRKDNAVLGERFSSLENAVRDAQDFWLRSPNTETLAKHQYALQSNIPIITFVNFKGGVGKTTICANLAAYFAEKGKRVLLIDCDYQGSLSDTVLSHARVENFTANSHLLIERDHERNVAVEPVSGELVSGAVFPVPREKTGKFIENRSFRRRNVSKKHDS